MLFQFDSLASPPADLPISKVHPLQPIILSGPLALGRGLLMARARAETGAG
jgi:hypothetical protein